MANYAFRPRAVSNQGPRSYIDNFSNMEHFMFEEAPGAGFLQWLNWMNPSTSARGNLSRMQQDLYNRYVSNQIRAPLLPDSEVASSFMEYLARLNPQREIHSQSPYARGTESRRFTQPARWVSF